MLFSSLSYAQDSDVPLYLTGIMNTTECDYLARVTDTRKGLILYFDTIPAGYYVYLKSKYSDKLLLEIETLDKCLPDCKVGSTYPLNEVRRLKGRRGDESQALYIKTGWFFHIRSPLCIRL